MSKKYLASMKKSIKSKWVKALESGKYRQTTNVLMYKDEHRHKTYCCLGVLTSLKPDAKFEDEESYLSKETKEWCQLKDLTGDNIQETLAQMNDGDNGKQYKFKEIAKFIKENIKGV